MISEGSYDSENWSNSWLWITELNYMSKYINYVSYMYECMYTSDVGHGEEWKLLTWPANVTEHLNMKQTHIDESSSVYSAKCTNVAYISASVNIVKISILIVSRAKAFLLEQLKQ